MLDVPLHSSLHPSAGRKPTGAKLVLKPVHVWGIRIRLQVALKARDLALFDLALESKLRGCDLVALKVSDLKSRSGVRSRVMILQRKTGGSQILQKVANELCEVRVGGSTVSMTRLEVVNTAVRNATANGNPAAQKIYDQLLNEALDEGPPVAKGVLIVGEELTVEEWLEEYGNAGAD